ncbi:MULTISPECIES: hypothetical protein [Moorena]|nr:MULTISPECIES: hypothetical protein [Moorena]
MRIRARDRVQHMRIRARDRVQKSVLSTQHSALSTIVKQRLVRW